MVAARHQVPDLPGRELHAVAADDLELDPGDGDPDRPFLLLRPLRRQVAEPRSGLGLAVHDEEPRRLEGLPHPADGVRSHGAPRLGEVAEPRPGERREIDLAPDDLERHRHAGEARAALGGQGLQDHAWVHEAVVEEDRPAGEKMGLQDAAPVAVGERQDEHGPVVGGEPQVLHDGAGVGVDVAEGLDHAARLPERAGGVEDQGWGVGMPLWRRHRRRKGRGLGRIEHPVLPQPSRGRAAQRLPHHRGGLGGVHHPEVERMRARHPAPGPGIPAQHEGVARPDLSEQCAERIGAPLTVDLDGACSQRLHGEPRDHGRRQVGKRDQDPLSRADAAGGETCREHPHPIGQVTVGEARFRTVHRRRIGGPFRVREDPVREERGAHAVSSCTASTSGCGTGRGGNS